MDFSAPPRWHRAVNRNGIGAFQVGMSCGFIQQKMTESKRCSQSSTCAPHYRTQMMWMVPFFVLIHLTDIHCARHCTNFKNTTMGKQYRSCVYALPELLTWQLGSYKCSPGSSLEWITIPFSRGIFLTQG